MSTHDDTRHDRPAETPNDAPETRPATGVTRREALGYLAALPLAGAIEFTPPSIERAIKAAEQVQAGAAPAAPKFFTAHEYRTVRILVDYVIPRDAKSGSATDAGVPEFMDFIMRDKPNNQVWMRGGLAWLDLECERRFGKRFADARDAQRRQVLDDIAYPHKVTDAMRPGAAFFSRFRDLTSSGFWTTKMGIADLQYMGNKMRPGWPGCPDAALTKLGVKYSDVYNAEGRFKTK